MTSKSKFENIDRLSAWKQGQRPDEPGTSVRRSTQRMPNADDVDYDEMTVAAVKASNTGR